ncbi:hypothetical protein B7P43_G09163 [Cryptotermes secundus]|uniref:CDT1 Geminin-binding domain-containing protein n=1 Tax=Cryptotermes secundus TaxID=105785 RepID=A0A2J7Q8P3_9NEOP|nr:DNA replication factor Cdt1 [Cryptotermes secundus]PNF24958.1 hypothetical protein B7P43_G09163 [Cryptotermes secundus]
MSQTHITSYFNKRKRAGDEVKDRKKVVVVDRHDPEAGVSVGKEVHVIHKALVLDTPESLHSVYKNKSLVEHVPIDCANKLTRENDKPVSYESQGKASEKPTNQERSQGRKATQVSKSSTQPTIHHILLKINGAEAYDKEHPRNGTTLHTYAEDGSFLGPDCSGPKEMNLPSMQGPVVFELKGLLSPKKRMRTGFIDNDKAICSEISDIQDSSVDDNSDGKLKENRKDTQECSVENDSDGKIKESRKELGLMTPHRMPISQQKDLSFEEIKRKLNRSEKLAELRTSLTRFDKSAKKLKALEEKRKEAEKLQLKKFQAIEIEVPASPQKNVFSSPKKVGTSPQSTPSKSPAYQRFTSLVLPASAALPLPFSYRCLAEIFRCVDAVGCMLYKRREMITFRKLKPAVQEMLRRNFTEHHLAQIKRVYPAAYVFHQEKCRNFGSTSKVDQYDLTLTPVLCSSVESCENSTELFKFTSDLLLQRRQTFHKILLEKVKDYHEDFLQSLNPPLTIPRDQLTRWHPEFGVDQVPDIEPDTLPEAPNVDKYCSAKDVLEKARNLFSCNLRMEKALQTVCEKSSQSEIPATPTKSLPLISGSATSPVSTILKGIPKALLEKIRARQAAKALQAMTRSPAQDHMAIQHLRLPELARILRNLYVTEKKSILTLDFVLEKLGNSYREKLPRAELEEHIHLLRKTAPGWLEIHYIRKTNYLKLSKNADMGPLIRKLEALAAEKSGR